MRGTEGAPVDGDEEGAHTHTPTESFNAGFEAAGTVDYDQAVTDITSYGDRLAVYSRRTRRLVFALGAAVVVALAGLTFSIVATIEARDAQAGSDAIQARIVTVQKRDAATAHAALVANCESKNAFRASVTAEWVKYLGYPALTGLTPAGVIQRDARNKSFLQFVATHDEPNNCNDLTQPTPVP